MRIVQSHLVTAEHKHAATDNAHWAGVLLDALIKRGGSLKDFEKRLKEKISGNSCDDE